MSSKESVESVENDEGGEFQLSLSNLAGFGLVRGISRPVRPVWEFDIASRLVLVSCMLMCLILVGCAQSDKTPLGTDDDLNSPHAVETVQERSNLGTQAPSTSDILSESPRQGGMLMIEVEGCGVPDPAIDVASPGSDGLLTLVEEIHVGLMTVVNDDAIGVKPELAQSFKVSDGGLLYEFLLRKDLKFSDGSSLTASDVKWSWERALRKSSGTSRANDIFRNVEGADALVQGHSEDLLGVKVVDDRRLEVRLVGPRPDFLFLLTDPVTYILSSTDTGDWLEAWVNHASYPGEMRVNTQIIPSSLPIGAGPFKLDEYAHPERTTTGYPGEARCVLKRNDHYWGQPAHLDQIVAVVNSDISDFRATLVRQMGLMEIGDLDILFDRTGLKDESNSPYHYLQVPAVPKTLFLTLNPSQKPLDDVYFRRALAMVIDVYEKIRKINGVPNQRRLVPSSLYFVNSDVAVLRRDIESAKHELEKSLYKDNIDEIDIILKSISTPDAYGIFDSAVFDVWRNELGINIEIERFDFENEIVFEDIQMTRVIFSPSYPSPHTVLMEFLEAVGEHNSSSEIADVRRMIEDAASELDDAERIRKYEFAERQILEQVLAIPLMTTDPIVNFILQPWVRGFSYSQYNGSQFQGVWLDKSILPRS